MEGWQSKGNPDGAYQPIGQLITGNNQNGRLLLFLLNDKGEIWFRFIDDAVDLNNWIPLGSPDPTTAEITVGNNQDGALELFAVAFAMVYHIRQKNPNGDWDAWEKLANGYSGLVNWEEQIRPSPSCIQCILQENGKLVVFVCGYDGIHPQGLLYKVQKSPGGDWEDWTGGMLPMEEPSWGKAGDPSRVNTIQWFVTGKYADGRIEVVIMTSHALWHCWQTQPNGSFTDFYLMNPTPTYNAWANSDLKIASNADGHLELFIQSGDGIIYHNWQQKGYGTYWTSWWTPFANTAPLNLPFPPGRYMITAPNQDGRLELFEVDRQNGYVKHIQQYAPSNGWNPYWHLLGKSAVVGEGLEDGAAGLDQNGIMHLFMLDQNEVWHLYQKTQNTWTAWGPSHPTDQITIPVRSKFWGWLIKLINGQD